LRPTVHYKPTRSSGENSHYINERNANHNDDFLSKT